LEVFRDLLYEVYVRRGQLQQALMVRRHPTEGATSRHKAAEKTTTA
jgi:hypothetical protein